jgi:hypothetical protein
MPFDLLNAKAAGVFSGLSVILFRFHDIVPLMDTEDSSEAICSISLNAQRAFDKSGKR